MSSSFILAFPIDVANCPGGVGVRFHAVVSTSTSLLWTSSHKLGTSVAQVTGFAKCKDHLLRNSPATSGQASDLLRLPLADSPKKPTKNLINSGVCDDIPSHSASSPNRPDSNILTVALVSFQGSRQSHDGCIAFHSAHGAAQRWHCEFALPARASQPSCTSSH